MQSVLGGSIGASGGETKIAGLYDLGETLGSGHFAIVKLAKHVFTGEKVAVKVVDKTKLDEVSRAHLFQEVRCMKLVQHPHVVRLYEVIDTQTKLYLVLELGDGGDLYDYIMKHEGGLTEDLAKKYFGQIVRAISYCHQLHVVHRDLKAENVVFFEKLGVVKLTDFGFSNKFCPGQKLETSCGSLAYSAPEILLGDSYDAPAVDVWSLGVILYMLVCGQLPFEKANDSETLTMIMDCKYTFPSYLSNECKQLISSMLVRDPLKRATLQEIAEHPWLLNNSEQIAAQDIGDYQPLVSREQVLEEDHKFIIQKMINGNVATKEEILSALDRDKYNHITATYFLLAERKLRQKRNEALQNRKSETGGPLSLLKKPSQLGKFDPNKLTVPMRTDMLPVEDTFAIKRTRKCSIVREEEDDEEDVSDSAAHSDSSASLARRGSKSEGRLNLIVQQAVFETQEQDSKIKPFSRLKNGGLGLGLGSAGSPLNCKDDTRMSSPTTKSLDELLDGIDISDTASCSVNSVPKGPIVLQKTVKPKTKHPMLTNRRTKLIQIRTPSCSSSEASDDDTKARKKKSANINDGPNRLHSYRRDSHDDSSDSQEQPHHFANSSARSARGKIQQSSSNEGKDQQNQQQYQQNSKENGKRTSTTSSSRNKKPEGLRTMRSSRARRHTTSRHKESQSLDRICETHEYGTATGEHINLHQSISHNKRNSITTATLIVDDEANPKFKSAQSDTNITNLINSAIIEDELFGLTPNDDAELNDLEEYKNAKTKAINTNTTKYSRAFKKISQLKKYFHVVNFS